MIAQVAVATGTHPDQWLDTDDAMLATVIHILTEERKE